MAAVTAEYDAVLREHFRAPRNSGVFPAGTPALLEGRAGARRLGREITLVLRFTADGRVAECRYRVYGCPATIALCSVLSERLPGKPVEALRDFSGLAFAEEFKLPPAKRAAGLALEDALRAALARYNMTSGFKTA